MCVCMHMHSHTCTCKHMCVCMHILMHKHVRARVRVYVNYTWRRDRSCGLRADAGRPRVHHVERRFHPPELLLQLAEAFVESIVEAVHPLPYLLSFPFRSGAVRKIGKVPQLGQPLLTGPHAEFDPIGEAPCCRLRGRATGATGGGGWGAGRGCQRREEGRGRASAVSVRWFEPNLAKSLVKNLVMPERRSSDANSPCKSCSR